MAFEENLKGIPEEIGLIKRKNEFEISKKSLKCYISCWCPIKGGGGRDKTHIVLCSVFSYIQVLWFFSRAHLLSSEFSPQTYLIHTFQSVQREKAKLTVWDVVAYMKPRPGVYLQPGVYLHGAYISLQPALPCPALSKLRKSVCPFHSGTRQPLSPEYTHV